MKSIKITIDGKTYNNLEEVPEEIRGKYTDILQRAQNMMGSHGPFSVDGPLPRFSIDGPNDGGKHTVSFSTVTSSININGETYNSLEEVPDEVRRAHPDLIANLTRAAYSGDAPSVDPENLLPAQDFDETKNARRRVKTSVKYHPLEKDNTPVDKNLIGTLAGIVALLLVALLVALLMHS